MADPTDPITVLMSAAADPPPKVSEGTTPDTPTTGEINPHTDLANAKRFAREHATDAKYCEPEKCWYVFTGQRWQRDDTGAAVRMAKETVARMLTEASTALAAAAGNREAVAEASQSVRWAITSQNANRIDNMLKLARSEPGIAVTPAQFDADPWLFNTTTHTVDLRTGQAREHCREDLITALCPHKFDESATCPTWQKFLRDVFNGDAEMVEFVHRLLGYLLTGDVSVHILIILYGTGSNGKTVFTEVVMALLGLDYAAPAPDSLFVGREEPHPAAVAELKGRRVVVSSETGSGGRLNEELVKRLTGGDRLKGRRLYGQFFDFDPTHKAIIATNHKPRVKEGGHGTWRRLRLIPFTVRFWNADRDEKGESNLKADPALKEKLAAEYAGILRWAIAGCADWLADGRRLTLPEKVKEATLAYQEEEDVFGQFLAERCVREEHSETAVKVLYSAYLAWCEHAHERPASKKAFGVKLTEAGFGKRESNGKTLYAGVRLSGDQWRSGDQTPIPQTSPSHTHLSEKYGSGGKSPLNSTDHHCVLQVWSDPDAFDRLMKAAGWDWNALSGWLNREHSAELPVDARFEDVLTDHRRVAVEHLTRLTQAA